MHPGPWSFRHSAPLAPTGMQLHSLCKHTPLRSITLLPHELAQRRQQHGDDGTNLRQAQQPHRLQGLQQLQSEQHGVLTADEERISHSSRADSAALDAHAALLAAAQQTPRPRRTECAALLAASEPHLNLLSLRQLSSAAWAAARLAARSPPSARWCTALLAAATTQLAVPDGGDDGGYETAVAALLQALVRLQLQPGQLWLQACCASMRVRSWRGARALSTAAACLPQLGCVPPPLAWQEDFYEASAVQLDAFPPLSLARTLHGAAAWRAMAPPPRSWLLHVVTNLRLNSSALKPSELAMTLQALQRLQDQSSLTREPLLPLPGQRPSSALQCAAQELLAALLLQLGQRAGEFRPRDLTVALHTLAMLQRSRLGHGAQDSKRSSSDAPLQGDALLQLAGPMPAGSDAVVVPAQLLSWQWLSRFLEDTQAGLADLDARGLATCLSALTQLVKPHLEVAAAVAAASTTELPSPPGAQHAQLGRMQQPSPVDSGAVRGGGHQGARLLPRPLQHRLPPQDSLSDGSGAAAAAAAAVLPPSELDAGNSSSSSSSGIDAVSERWGHWLSCFYTASVPRLSCFSAEDLSVTICALAAAHAVPPLPWYAALLDVAAVRAPELSGGQAAGIAGGLARLALLPCLHDPGAALVPSPGWMARLYSPPPSPPHTDGDSAGAGTASHAVYDVSCCSAAELARLAWAAAVCECDPGELWWRAAEKRLQECGRHEQQGAALLPPHLLGALLQAYASSGRTLPKALLQQIVLSQAATQSLLAAPVCDLLRVLRALRPAASTLPRTWVAALATGLQYRLAELPPAYLPQLLGCLAGVGLGPERGPVLTSATGPSTRTRTTETVAWRSAALEAGTAALPKMRADGAAQLLWAAAALGLEPPPEWVDAVLAAVAAEGFRCARPRALALVLRGLSGLGYVPPRDWLAGLMMATHRRAAALCGPSGRPGPPSREGAAVARELVLLLRSLGGLRGAASPNPRWLRTLLLCVHGQLPLLRPADISGLMMALAALRVRPGTPLLRSLLAALGDCHGLCDAQLVHVAQAAAALRWRPDRTWWAPFLAASEAALPRLPPRHLALLLWAVAMLRLMPPPRWRDTSLRAVRAALPRLSPHELGMVLWGLGRTRAHLVPRVGDSAASSSVLMMASARWAPRLELAAGLLGAAWRARHAMSAAGLVHALAGVAALRLQPGQTWLQGMLAAGGAKEMPPGSLSGYELAQLARALALLGYVPNRPWLRALTLLLEVRPQPHARSRHSAAWALGRLEEAAAVQCSARTMADVALAERSSAAHVHNDSV